MTSSSGPVEERYDVRKLSAEIVEDQHVIKTHKFRIKIKPC
jgi:hypothetical protein